MRNRKHLLPASIDALISGSLSDPATPGLTIEIRRSGKKIWLYRRRISGSGRIVRVTLGAYPALSIAAARTTEANSFGVMNAWIGGSPEFTVSRPIFDGVRNHDRYQETPTVSAV